ncbi:MAG: hypothetical protein M3680_00870 [Myxococcota bacterium]|nr:hypothetical protein [Myxococcota bacterium]
MLLILLPLVASAVAVTGSASGAQHVVASGRVAQVRLAETLAEAESIESVTARGRGVTFSIVRDGAPLDVRVTTRRSGAVVALTIRSGRPIVAQLHSLTWLATELAGVTAVTTLLVDGAGTVSIGTNDGQRYVAIPSAARTAQARRSRCGTSTRQRRLGE